MSAFWSPVVSRLVPYTPGEQPRIEGLIKLNTNENPYPPSTRVSQAIAAISADSLRLYPDPESHALRHAIGAYWGVDASEVFVGNGSDEVLAFVFQGLLDHTRPLAFPDITYSFYPSYCSLFGIHHTLIPLTEDFRLDLSRVPDDAGALIFANPNAPTGRAIDPDEIAALLQRRPDMMVVVDEAYVDFGARSCVPLIRTCPNLLVTQSLSKSRALAGLRVGFAIGQAGLLEALVRIKNSFNSYPIDRIAGAAASAAMEDVAWFNDNRDRVMSSRERMASGLTDLGFDVLPSAANFVFARHPDHDAAFLASGLRDRKILVRHFARARIDQHLRISVGTEDQINALLMALSELTGT
jgi:histidinol-phosphate aminotransferase